MKRIIISAAAILVLAGTAAIAAAGEKSYVDASADAGTAPDLTNVTVTDSNGFLAFKITGTLMPSTSFVIFVDTDRNQSTGDDGDELMFGVDQEADGKNYWFASRWNGSKWERAGIDVQSQAYPGRHELGFRVADAGITGSFDFVVVSFKWLADAVEASDRAPDSIVPWTYEMTSRAASTAVKVTLGAVQLVPTRVVAGKPFTVRVPVRIGDSGQPFAGAVSCTARIKGRTIRGTGATTNGLASCRLLLPKGTTGSTAQGSIIVGSGAQAVTKTFRFRIA